MAGWLDSIGATAIKHFLFVIFFLQGDALGLLSIFCLFCKMQGAAQLKLLIDLPMLC